MKMAGYHPTYCIEYDIEINQISIGLENFIDKINEKNKHYKNEIREAFKYDIIHYDVAKNQPENKFIITVKLFYTYSNLSERLLLDLLRENDVKWSNVRSY